ncbi:hypothetical protein [Pontixanthobacter aquaemixtae]|uniref:Uncharacterized protein n=1 Tax=Pontixanthobacter aquaemixtae TaxID=1958940 RepID=A0A844ZWC2_9SPHN|nr:hypothetical protein [Pontixanthobacter aquaemixtae]MXO91480.1 hypothetical protein [Pontixanthobacter aquaemixtae]
MKPQSIKTFDFLYLGSLVLGVINFVVTRNETMAMLEADPATAQLGSGFLYGAFAFGMGISLLLWFLISNVKSKVAMWIMIVLFVIGVLMTPASLAGMSMLGTVFVIAVTVMQAASIFYLFRPDAKAYLSNDPVDHDTFK